MNVAEMVAQVDDMGRAYNSGLHIIETDMIGRDSAMRSIERYEARLREMEAEIVLASLRANADEPGLDIFRDCKNDRQRDAALVQWRNTEPYYIETVAKLDRAKVDRARIEASLRARELALSLIKRTIEFDTAVVMAITKGIA